MRTYLLTTILAIIVLAGEWTIKIFQVNNFLEKPTLRFRDDGTFKIVQFTDLHYGNPRHTLGNQAIQRAILEAEKPDLVVITVKLKRLKFHD